MTVTPSLADATASITVNGTAVASGSASQAINLNIGNNTITVVVTAQDGSTIKTYTITVNRAGSGNADLSSLTVSQGTLTPAFAAGTMSYTDSVANSITSMTVTPTLDDATGSITVNGTAVASGSASQAITLNVGNNTITMVVTAQDRHHYKDLHHYRKPSALQQCRPEQPHREPGDTDPCLCSRNDELHGLRGQHHYQHDCNTHCC